MARRAKLAQTFPSRDFRYLLIGLSSGKYLNKRSLVRRVDASSSLQCLIGESAPLADSKHCCTSYISVYICEEPREARNTALSLCSVSRCRNRCINTVEKAKLDLFSYIPFGTSVYTAAPIYTFMKLVMNGVCGNWNWYRGWHSGPADCCWIFWQTEHYLLYCCCSRRFSLLNERGGCWECVMVESAKNLREVKQFWILLMVGNTQWKIYDFNVQRYKVNFHFEIRNSCL